MTTAGETDGTRARVRRLPAGGRQVYLDEVYDTDVDALASSVVHQSVSAHRDLRL